MYPHESHALTEGHTISGSAELGGDHKILHSTNDGSNTLPVNNDLALEEYFRALDYKSIIEYQTREHIEFQTRRVL